MIQSILGIIRQATERGFRAVVLVPATAYAESLNALTCAYPVNSGRTAVMPCGKQLTLVTPGTPIEEIPGPFHLYLYGWGYATPVEERLVPAWLSKAATVYTEIS